MAKIYRDGQWVDEATAYAPKGSTEGGSGVDWGAQVNDLYDQISNRAPFSYDAMKDPMYLAAKDQFTRLGQQAMTDTMGQAAGLTGGYGSTYAQNVGNQAYDDYMTQLSSVGAEYAQQARAAYDKDLDDLYDRYNLAAGMEAKEYDRGRDALGDARYENELAYARERDAISDQRYQDELNYSRQQQTLSDARSYVTYLLGMGIMPSAEQLATAGMTQDEANGIKNYYLKQQAAAGAGSGGGGGSNPKYTPSSNPKTPADEGSENEDTGTGGKIPETDLAQFVRLFKTKGYDAALDAFAAAYDPTTPEAIEAWKWIVSRGKSSGSGSSSGGGTIQPKPIDFVMPY